MSKKFVYFASWKIYKDYSIYSEGQGEIKLDNKITNINHVVTAETLVKTASNLADDCRVNIINYQLMRIEK